jgi:hypothetical protein
MKGSSSQTSKALVSMIKSGRKLDGRNPASLEIFCTNWSTCDCGFISGYSSIGVYPPLASLQVHEQVGLELRCACCKMQEIRRWMPVEDGDLLMMGVRLPSHPPYSFDKTCRTIWIIAFSRSAVIGFYTASVSIFW